MKTGLGTRDSGLVQKHEAQSFPVAVDGHAGDLLGMGVCRFPESRVPSPESRV